MQELSADDMSKIRHAPVIELTASDARRFADEVSDGAAPLAFDLASALSKAPDFVVLKIVRD